MAHVEADRGDVLLAQGAEDGAGDGVARRQLVDEALAVAVVQRRALAADRLGDQEALATGEADDRRGVELGELEVGERGAGVAGEHEAGAERAGRVGGARPQGGGAAGGEDGAARGQRPPVLELHAGAAAVVAEQASGAGALEHLDAGVLGDDRRELAQDPPAGGAAAGVHDAAGAVAALEPEGEVAVPVGVEAHPEYLQLVEAGGRLARQDLGGGAADELPARGQRVLQVELRRVVDRERRREPALGPVGGGLGERARRDERDPGALAGRRQAGEQPGRTRADDDEIGPWVHGRPYGTGVPPLWLRHDASLSHEIPGHPERPERIRALEAEMARHDWFGLVRIEAPSVDRALLESIHPAPYVAALEGLCTSGGGFLDADTAAVPDTFEAALRAAGGAVALADGLLGGR